MAADCQGKSALENLPCYICHENYKDPRKITCGHSFCLRCLHQHIIHVVKDSKTRTFPCPLCRMDNFPINTREGKETWAKAFPVDIMLKNCVKVIEMGNLPPPDYERGIVGDNDIHLCPVHKKTLAVYCLHHKMVVCDRCVWQEHNLAACNVIPVQKTSDVKEEMVRTLTNRFKDQSKRLKENTQTFVEREGTLKSSLDFVLNRLNSFETDVENLLRKMLEEINKLRKDSLELFENIKSHCSGRTALWSMLRNAKSVLSDIKRSDDCIWILKTLKLLEIQMQDMETEMDSNFNTGNVYKLELTIDEDISKLIKRDLSFGTIQAKKVQGKRIDLKYISESADELDTVGPRGRRRPRTRARKAGTRVNQRTLTESADELETDEHRNRTATVERGDLKLDLRSLTESADELDVVDSKANKGVISDRFKFKASVGDESECLLSAIACLADHVLVTDNENGSVKLFTADGEFVDSLPVPDCCGLCVMPNNSDVVVSQPDHRKLSFLTVNKRMFTRRMSGSQLLRLSSASKEKTIDIKFERKYTKRYSPLCCVNVSTFVAACCEVSKPSVDLINNKGEIIRSVTNPIKGALYFKDPQCLSVYPSGHILVADSALNRVAKINISSNDPLPKFSSTNTRPSGVFVDNVGNVIVCQIDRNTVRCYTTKGDNYLLVKKKHKVRKPLGVAMSDEYLYVTEEYPSRNVIRFKINMYNQDSEDV